MSLTDEALAELETKHKRIARVRGKANADGSHPWEIVIRKPTRAEYKRFRSHVSNENTKADATELLVRAVVVFPTPDAFDALLEEWPAIPEAASEALLRLMGLAVEADLKA